MKKIPTADKISDFRDLINGNSRFVCQNYTNKDNKNYWNIICSCMDWITVSINYLNKLPRFESDIDVRVMQVYSVVSSVDIIWQSIIQLHRIFINSDVNNIPFATERVCFSNRIYSEDDNDYFKSIRAAFGAHPVNLKGVTDRKYASWPYPPRDSEDTLSISLYSNGVDVEDLYMGLSLSEIFCFLNRRYEYLDVISTRILTIYERERNKYVEEIIIFKKRPLDDLLVLKRESLLRFDDDYYNSIIEDLLMIFGCDEIDGELVGLLESYRESLIPLIDELKVNLQSVNLVGLNNERLLNIDTELTKKLSYQLSKFYSWMASGFYDPLFEFYLKSFNEESDCKFKFSTEDSKECLFLKLKLMIYESNQSSGF